MEQGTPENVRMVAASAPPQLPAFWGNRPALWFRAVEAKFNLALPKITREVTRFEHVICVLPPEVAAEVSDIIENPDPTKPYTKLKEEIIKRMSLSEAQRLKQLLSGQELGSRKPSQLLRHMKSLVGDEQYVNSNALRELFLQQMPVSIQPILIALGDLPVDRVATIADQIMEATPSAAISAVAPSKNYNCIANPNMHVTYSGATANQPDAILTMILDRLDNLERQLAYRNQNQNHHARARNRSRSKSHDKGRDQWCYYHRRFGNKAQHCTTPCAYSKNSQQTQE